MRCEALTSNTMPALCRGTASTPPAEGAEQKPALPQLPSDVWQRIARMALAAEDGDTRVWARLSAVSSLWRAAVSCAVVPAESPPGEDPTPGEASMSPCHSCKINHTMLRSLGLASFAYAQGDQSRCLPGDASAEQRMQRAHSNAFHMQVSSVSPHCRRRNDGHSALRTPVDARSALVADQDSAAAAKHPLQPAGQQSSQAAADGATDAH